MKFAKFLRTPFFTEHLRRLLLTSAIYIKRRLHCQIYSTFSLTPTCWHTKYHCNQPKNKRNHKERKSFSSPAYLFENTLFWLRASKKLSVNRDQMTRQRQKGNLPKMKAKYKAKVRKIRRHISVEIICRQFSISYCMRSDLWKIFKTPEESISRTNIFIISVGKNFFHHERFSRQRQVCSNSLPPPNIRSRTSLWMAAFTLQILCEQLILGIVLSIKELMLSLVFRETLVRIVIMLY